MSPDTRTLFPEIVNEGKPEQHCPEVLKKVFGAIADKRGFLCWRSRQRGDRIDKVPIDPKTGEIPNEGNSATERATLTLHEALENAARWGAGVGCNPGKLGIISADLDEALTSAALLRSSLAQVIGCEEDGTGAPIYLETSPSVIGLRGLLIGDVPADVGSGREIGSIGLYYNTSKFTTITGMAYAGPQEIVAAQEVVDRAVDRMRRLAADMDGTGQLSAYSGKGGAELALQHLRDGTAVHEPLMFLGSYWARATSRRADTIMNTLFLEVERAIQRFHNDPDQVARYQERRTHIPRWTEGAIRKFGSSHQKRTAEEEAKLCAQLKAQIAERKARVQVAQVSLEDRLADVEDPSVAVDLIEKHLEGKSRGSEEYEACQPLLARYVDQVNGMMEVEAAQDLLSGVVFGPPPPRGVLPGSIEDLSFGYQDALGTDPSGIAAPLLQMVSCLPHPDTKVTIMSSKRADFVQPPHMFAGVIANPSSQKSLGQQIAEEALTKIQAHNRNEVKRRREIRITQLITEEAMTKEKAEKQAASEIPRAPLLLTDNPTVESMRDVLFAPAQRQYTLNLFVDELNQILNALFSYKASSTAVEDIIEGYEARSKVFTRASISKGVKRDGEIIHVDRWAVGIFGTIQWPVFLEMEENYKLLNSGLAQRFAWFAIRREVAPSEKDGRPLSELRDELAEIAMGVFRLAPQTYSVSEEATALWRGYRAFLRQQAERLGTVGDDKAAQEFLLKGAALVLRLSLVLHLVDHVEIAGPSSQMRAPAAEIDCDTMQRAWRLYERWILPHIFTVLARAREYDALTSIAGWILAQDAAGKNYFDRRALRSGPSALRREFYQVAHLVIELEQAGWLIPETDEEGEVHRDARGYAFRWRSPRGISGRYRKILENYQEARKWMDELRNSRK